MLPKSSITRNSNNFLKKDFDSFLEEEKDIYNFNYVNEELHRLNLDIDNLIEDSKTVDLIDNKNCSYTYNCVENLEINLNHFYLNNNYIENINICSYHINVEGSAPFLQYFLYKNSEDTDFSFPSFPYSDNLDIMMKSLTILEVLYMSYYKNSSYSYKGYKIYKNNLYMFFDCSKMNVSSVILNKNNDLWLVLIDEIVNKRQVCQYGIKKDVTDYFIKNPEFLYLINNDTDIFYETPTVVYSLCKEKQLYFCSIFGISPEMNEMNLFGNYYYFTDFDTIVRGKTEESGLIRLAIFLKNTMVKMNLSDDLVDTSEITSQLLEKYYDVEKKETFNNLKMTLRISDRAGEWTKKYDSIYVGEIELDDGKYFEKAPLWVIKDYSQQLVLSSHLLDKTNCCIK